MLEWRTREESLKISECSKVNNCSPGKERCDEHSKPRTQEKMHRLKLLIFLELKKNTPISVKTGNAEVDKETI